MPGGLELAADTQEEGDLGSGIRPRPVGGLERASSGPGQFDQAINLLRESAVHLDPDAVSIYATRANGAYPTWKEMEAEVRKSMEEEQRAGQSAVQSLRNPPINRSLPFMRAGAAMMRPTRTGSIGESAGNALGEYAAGMGDENKQELDFGRRASEMEYGVSKDKTKNSIEMFGLGQKSQQLDTMLAMMRQKMSQGMFTPAMKEWAVKNNIDVNDPQWMRRLTPEQRQDLEKFVLLARGTTQMKNAKSMLDPSDPQFANMVRLLNNEKLKIQAMKAAEARHPMSAYQGQDVSVRNAAVNSELLQILRDHSLGQTLGTPLGEELKRAEGAVPGPIAAPAAPGQAPAAAAAADAPAPEGPPHPFDEFMTPASFKPNRPGQIQSEQNEAAQKTAAAEAEKRASKFIETEVQPGIKAADETRTNAIIAKALLDKDPKLTGSMKPFMATVGNIMETLGVAPKNVQQFVSDQKIFGSQAMLQVLAKQLDQKGVQTESDAKRIMAAGIDPSNPPAANRFLIRYMEASANRMQERAAFFDRWAKKNGGQIAGSVEAWSAYSKKYPMAVVHDGKVHFRDVPLPE